MIDIESIRREFEQNSNDYTKEEIDFIINEIKSRHSFNEEDDDIVSDNNIISYILENFTTMMKISDINIDAAEGCIEFNYDGVCSLEWLKKHSPHVGAEDEYVTLDYVDSHIKFNLDASDKEKEIIREYLEFYILQNQDVIEEYLLQEG